MSNVGSSSFPLKEGKGVVFAGACLPRGLQKSQSSRLKGAQKFSTHNSSTYGQRITKGRHPAPIRSGSPHCPACCTAEVQGTARHSFRLTIHRPRLLDTFGGMAESTTIGAGAHAESALRAAVAPSNAGQDSQPKQSSTPGHSLQSLERLPNELLLPIAAALIPPAPLTTRFALRPTGTWEFRTADLQWADWLAGHYELLKLAQTSRRMATIAKPLLYHTLVIHDSKALVTLFRRMRQYPHIRPWIRNLTFLLNITDLGVIRDTHREWTSQFRGITPLTSSLPNT